MQVYIAFCAGSICGVWEGRRTHDGDGEKESYL